MTAPSMDVSSQAGAAALLTVIVPEFDSPVALVEQNYPGQNPMQLPIHLVVDWEERTVGVETRSTLGGTPAREWNGLASTYRLPNDIRADRLRDGVVEHVLPVLIEILGTFEAVWNGSNWVGQFDAGENGGYENHWAVDRAIERLDCCDGDIPGLVEGWWWLEPVIGTLVTATATDEEIERIAVDVVADAREASAIIYGGADDVAGRLRYRRDELVDAAEVA